MSLGCGSVAYRIEKHTQHFEIAQDCLICGMNDEADVDAEMTAETEAKLEASFSDKQQRRDFKNFFSQRKIAVLSSGASERNIANRELVHLSCHPNQPYHRECLSRWVTKNASCPIDRRNVDPAVPTIKKPAIHVEDPTAKKVSAVFFKYVAS